MIDRYLLRYFLGVIDCGSFSKAAQQLNVAQPTLSVGIAKLERLLGVAVFQRSSKRVQLTEAGSRLAAHARRIEREFNLAESAVTGLKPLKGLRLGVISTFPMKRLSAAMDRARANAVNERLLIITGSEHELLQRLNRGQIDVALTIIRPDETRYISETLFTERYRLAIPSFHPLAGSSNINAEDLADNSMIVRRHCEVLSETSKHFTERGVRPFIAFRTTNDEQVLALVSAGLGVTVMPESYSLSGVLRPTLTGFELSRDIGLLFGAQTPDLQQSTSPLLQALRADLIAG